MTIRNPMTKNIHALERPDGVRDLVDALALSELVALLLVLRGYADPEAARAFLDHSVYRPAPPEALPGLEVASLRLQRAVTSNERVLIWGDFDVDGLASAALLHDALVLLGADVQIHIAERHGIRLDVVRSLCKSNPPALFVACDTGMSSHKIVDYTNSIGVDFLILDHHHLPDQLPAAMAVVNPNLLAEGHPLRAMPGVGVAFLTVQHLLTSLDEMRKLDRFLELLPLGIIGDVAEQVADTRYWLQRGLAALQKANRPGLNALIERLGLDANHLSGEDVAFRIAPALNAFGRLEEAQHGFELMTTRNARAAGVLATQAYGFNQQRQLITAQMLEAAREQVAADPSLLNFAALVLENPQWEGGVLGAVANRLAEEQRRVVVLLTSDERGIASGAARSFGGLDITAALTELDELLVSYGGHSGAAGLSLDIDNLPLFRRRLSNALQAQQPEVEITETVAEAELQFSDLSLDLAHDVEQLAPFGRGNPRPIFVTRNLKRVRGAKIGRQKQHRRLTLRDEKGIDQTVLWWNSTHLDMPDGLFDLAYRIAPVFRDGAKDLQITLVDWLQTEAPAEDDIIQPEVIDLRAALDLESLRADEPSLMVWADGLSQRDSPGVALSELEEAEALLIFTAPPGPHQLEKAIGKVHPQRVYLHGQSPPFDDSQRLLEALTALLRAAQDAYSGKVKLAQLAERTAHTPETIRIALETLADHIEIEWVSSLTIQVISAPPSPQGISAPELERAIEETAAFRRYVQHVSPDNLLT